MINVYFADIGPLSDEALFASLYNRISPARQEKVSSFRFPKGKRLSLAAAILLDQGLKPYGLHEQDMKYGFGEKGKPFLIGHPEIAFSISHSEEKVMVAVSGACQSTACQLGADGPRVTTCQLGADIEKIETADLALAKRFFASAEHEILCQLQPGAEQDQAFYRLWTLKESFIKATGRGLALPLKSFQVDLGNDYRGPALSQTYDDNTYQLIEIDAYPGYKSAICINQAAAALNAAGIKAELGGSHQTPAAAALNAAGIKIHYIDLRSI